ncbi:MAG: OmpA family protein [Sandaracinaceae bacterium]
MAPEDRRKRWLGALLIALLLAVGWVPYAGVGWPADEATGVAGLIPSDIQRRTENAVAAAGFGQQVTVEARGRAVTLSGQVATDVEARRLRRMAERMFGVTWVTSNIEVVDGLESGRFAPRFYDLTMSLLRNGVLELSGEVPDEDTKEALLGAFPSSLRVEDDLEVDPGVPHEGFRETWSVARRCLGDLFHGRISLREGQLSVEGVLPSTSPQGMEATLQLRLSELPDPYRAGDLRLTRAVDLPVEETEACNRELAQVLDRTQIRFATGSAVIEEESMPLLDRLADAVRHCGDLTLLIEGHTDNVGESEANQRLSEDRADSVRHALQSRGLERERLEVRGYGEDRPDEPNSTYNGRAANRRIVMRVLRSSAWN